MPIILTLAVTCFDDTNDFWANNRQALEDLAKRKDVELIVVNTFGPSSKINENLLQLISDHSHLSLISTSKRERQAIGRNIALETSQGRYIWFIDSDDVFRLPEEKQLGEIEADVISMNFDMQLSDMSFHVKVNGSNGLDAKGILFLLSTNRISNACWPYLYKTSIIKDSIRFGDYFFEDLVFNLRVFGLQNVSYAHLSSNLYKYLYYPNSTSRGRQFSKIIHRWVAVLVALKVIMFNLRIGFSQKVILAALYFAYHGIWLTLKR